MEAYPLQWPDGYKRTLSPRSSKFDTTFAVARDTILKEVKLLGAKNPVISTNIPLRQDGLPYASYSRLMDKGVAVYFTYNDKQMVLACDRWDKVEDNMQAIRKAIEALRGLDRWGVSDMLNRAFTGFTALPASTKKKWFDVMGIPPSAGKEWITSAYRKLSMERHPDKGGSTALFQELNEAYQEGLKQAQS
jgi:hypothetical protein